jgi:hypothetical protein
VTDILKRLRDNIADYESMNRTGSLLSDAATEIEALRTTLNQALGIIVEFGNLNGFRNMSDAELGKAVIGMAERIAEVLPQPKL